MPSTSVRLSLADTKPAATAADVLILAIGSGRGRALEVVSTGLTAAQATRVVEAARAVGATGKSGEVTRIPSPTGFTADSIAVVGLGDSEARADREALRRAFGSAIRSLAGTRKVALASLNDDASTDAAILGTRLGAYRFDDFRAKSKKRDQTPPGRIVVLVPGPLGRDSRTELDGVEAIGSAIALVRDLVNTPPNALPPEAFAEAAIAAVNGLPVDVAVWDEEALAADGCGGILGVGQGSATPPRLVRLSYGDDGATAHLALVGKGITFDTGGISIKPAANMDHMKGDMAGAAAVLGAIVAIAKLRLPVRVTAWMACAENMPSGTAQRPGDVITIADDTTVEVLNTDAEGRLVLADALALAVPEKPDLIVDIATLTGAQRIALGARVAGVMANTDSAREQVCDAANACGEAMWPMPMPDYLRGTLDSATADIANLGDGLAGMLVGGVFLKEFVPAGQPWAHVDIAGPSFNDKAPYGYVPKGGTGMGVRTLVELAARMCGQGAATPAG